MMASSSSQSSGSCVAWDRVSELQEQLDSLSTLFFTCIGVIQRDAPRASLSSVEHTSLSAPFQDTLTELASQIAQNIKQVEYLVSSLPEATEVEQLAAIATLEGENAQVAQRMRGKMTEAENCLRQLRSLTDRLVAEWK